jgi:hypothetical protein
MSPELPRLPSDLAAGERACSISFPPRRSPRGPKHQIVGKVYARLGAQQQAGQQKAGKKETRVGLD